MRISKQSKQQRKIKILEQSAELFINEGYNAVTIRRIAKITGLATGTLFNYFPNKESLAMNIIMAAFAKGQIHYQKRCSNCVEPKEELHLLINSVLRQLRPYRSFLGPVLEKSFSPFPKDTVSIEGKTAQQQQLMMVSNIMDKYNIPASENNLELDIYWSLYLGILAFWMKDNSKFQQNSQPMVANSIALFVNSISR
ncbi:MAG: TetR/AcrR family transcriptional regulator [Gammaproteobacteria bacterium]|nr:MAG: TetR/AcrR family transcriptional regulator [Gammaproteobacteria bacterium]